ncbi:MAG: nuclear transport factor 2 family protein [Novosphingobium sp.]|nr:nuclear transport factor 2 family protein [Novosphingobium sp.]MCP5404400.1 nuclear transport factor 2 family protein [Novosphingobium sp.]
MGQEGNERLDYLMSRMDILDCINRIARGVDRLDRDIFRTGYHDDAILDFGTHIGTPDQHMDFFFDLHAKMQTATAHTICNHTCEIDGDVAHTETYYIYGSENTSGTPVTVAGGRYVDRFERRKGRWAISLRKCVPTWNMTPDSDVSKQIAEAFRLVGNNVRDRSDMSYQRPSTLSPDRLAAAQAQDE